MLNIIHFFEDIFSNLFKFSDNLLDYKISNMNSTILVKMLL